MDLTVKEYAAKQRVHELTVRRWVRTGAVDFHRTPGGQIRIVERPLSVRRDDARPDVLKR